MLIGDAGSADLGGKSSMHIEIGQRPNKEAL